MFSFKQTILISSKCPPKLLTSVVIVLSGYRARWAMSDELLRRNISAQCIWRGRRDAQGCIGFTKIDNSTHYLGFSRPRLPMYCFDAGFPRNWCRSCNNSCYCVSTLAPLLFAWVNTQGRWAFDTRDIRVDQILVSQRVFWLFLAWFNITRWKYGRIRVRRWQFDFSLSKLLYGQI